MVGRFFLQMEWATVLMCPTLMRMRMGHSRADWCVYVCARVCLLLRVTSPLVVSILTGIIVD